MRSTSTVAKEISVTSLKISARKSLECLIARKKELDGPIEIIQATTNHRAYSARGNAAKPSIFAALLYTATAANHLVYASIWLRETASSSKSLKELIAPATNSDLYPSLRNTSTDIQVLPSSKVL